MSQHKQQLTDDATIKDIVDTLDHPINYVRQVLGNMKAIRREHGSAVVQIGVTGQGICPHYRVAPGREDEATFSFFLDDKPGAEKF